MCIHTSHRYAALHAHAPRDPHRAAIPIFAVLGSIFIEGKNPTGTEFASLGVVFLGVAVSMWEGSDTRASLLGIGCCLLGTISNGLMMSSIGRLMSEKVDVLRLTFYTAPLTCFMLLPFYLHNEAHDFAVYQSSHSMSYVGEERGAVAGSRSRRYELLQEPGRMSHGVTCCAAPMLLGPSNCCSAVLSPTQPSHLTSHLHTLRPAAPGLCERAGVQPGSLVRHQDHISGHHHRDRGDEDHPDPGAVIAHAGCVWYIFVDGHDVGFERCTAWWHNTRSQPVITVMSTQDHEHSCSHPACADDT